MSKLKSPDRLLLPVRDAALLCSTLSGAEIAEEDLQLLFGLYFLPFFDSEVGRQVLRADLVELAPVAARISDWATEGNRAGRTLFDAGRPRRAILPDHSLLDLPGIDEAVDPAYFAAARGLIQVSSHKGRGTRANLGYFPPTRIAAESKAVAETVAKQLERFTAVRFSRAGEFANSAHYMGSKRELSPFLIECFSQALGPGGTVIDLMCGSGVIAGAAARFWPTYASDSQAFCRLLALVQGGGFSRHRAEAVLGKLLLAARDHSEALCMQLHSELVQEDNLFHADLNDPLRARYAHFVESYPLYPSERVGGWCSLREVERRQSEPRAVPYLLFSSYFANVYFGVRQCVEIDSLRFAIDTLEDETERDWALGALVASASRLATTYAGHFAQPLVRRWGEVTLNELSRIIERRSLSVFHEFSVRAMNLAEESENVAHPVRLIQGPWRVAVQHVLKRANRSEVLVYVDPPYRREEYSRYYHVLETLVTYGYPTVTGSGRVPSKSAGGRFASEFFTRSRTRMTDVLSEVIETVLCAGWQCAWSYADNSDASIVAVLRALEGRLPLSCRSYATPYQHQSQGGRKPKQVTEYLVMLKRH